MESNIKFNTGKLARLKGFSYCPTFGEGIEDVPTQSILQKWLREKHKIEICIEPFLDIGESVVYQQIVYSAKITEETKVEDTTLYNKYEEALEVALVEALNLI